LIALARIKASSGCMGEIIETSRLAAAVTLDAAELDAARLGFHRAFPRRSAKRTIYITQVCAALVLIAALVLALRAWPASTTQILHASVWCVFATLILWRLFAAASLSPMLSRIAEPTSWPTYTILCPLYREANIVAALAAALERLDYPKHALDIKLIVESDDAETVAAALAVADRPHIEVISVPAATPRTKPKALNAGLARARGEYVVVYDAEDRPHPQQLRAALAAFEDGGPQLACVQAPLAIDNHDASWISRQFAAEYAIQFREILPLIANLGLPLPLGGSSNHFRIEALKRSGGWDPYNVTEDADLGYRLARDGWRADVISPPTWEEAPESFGVWLNQRSRWIKGHMQTWLVLMREPFKAAREMGLGAFASMHLVLGGGILAAFVHGPIFLVVMIAALSPYNILGTADFLLALFGYCVALFTALTASALTGSLSHIRAAFTMPLYWPLQSIAAYRAVFELIFRPHFWAKTAHGAAARTSIQDRAAAADV
jgi:glycosyltransferase XagB